MLDETQTDWTDDLSSIGYSLTGTLPTVDTINSINYDMSNWMYTQSGKAINIPSGGTVDIYARGAAKDYDSSKSYAVMAWQSTAGYYNGKSELSMISNSGKIAAVNETENTLAIRQIRVAVCSSSQTTVVKVYSTSTGEHFNAFKYVLSDITYYFVLDNIQTDWSRDLNSLGYSLTQTIHSHPSVSIGDIFPYNKINTSTSSGKEQIIYADSNTKSSLPQLVYYNTDLTSTPYYMERTNDYRVKIISQDWGLSFQQATVDSSIKLVFSVINNTSSTIQFSGVKMALSSNMSIVVKVYNINTKTFIDAYKNTVDDYNTSKLSDYYYVLDGVQNSWTNNLNSIGYVENQIIKLYFNQNNIYDNTVLSENNFMFYVYKDTNGTQKSTFEGGTSSTQWEILGLYNVNGEELDFSEDYIRWINSANIYYKSVSSRGLQAQYVLLRIS